MTEQLKPCPFCGNTDLKSGGDDKIVGVWCENCQMAGPNHYGGFDWNTRPSATPGNTDPIAKDDDELRKVQGGWREDVDTDFICPPIPDRSHDWYARFKWHDGDTDLRGHGKTELDAVFDLFRNALDFDDGDGSEQETILDAAWLGIGGVSPTEHPTEQPVYETCSKCSGSGQMIGDAGEPTLCSECKGDTVVASEQPSVRDAAWVKVDDVIKLAHGMTGDWDHIEVHSFEAALRALEGGA